MIHETSTMIYECPDEDVLIKDYYFTELAISRCRIGLFGMLKIAEDSFYNDHHDYQKFFEEETNNNGILHIKIFYGRSITAKRKT